jgi:SH3-like domain-containing protein
MPKAFSATHLVPSDGLDARLSPSSQTAIAARLDGGLDVQLLERRGEWAQIACSNGWTAWVDVRRLIPTEAAVSAPVLIDDVLSQAIDAALARYADLVGELQAGRIDETAFQRDAYRAGLIVRDSEAWMLDLATERWWRYDGLSLTTIDTGGVGDEGAERA